MRVKKSVFAILLIWALAIFSFQGVFAQGNVRTRLNVPDILGYKTLLCDFHMHTVFSDGTVWPNIRPEEAWREGLDAIAITDHIEYQAHKGYIEKNHNASYKLAKGPAHALKIILIHGAEITRSMPPGHLNAIFIKDGEKCDTEKWQDALKAAADQGAFITWNHPGWRGQQPDGISRWYKEHDYLLKNNQLHGIEIVNQKEYYPRAHKWCLEKKLTMLGNSDIHYPSNLTYDIANGEHRPVNLVFAKEASEDAIKEALFARRTAVYFKDLLIGEEKFLRPIYDKSVEVLRNKISITGKWWENIFVKNTSGFDMKLKLKEQPDGITAPGIITLYAGKTVAMRITSTQETLSAEKGYSLSYSVENFLVEPERGLSVNIPVTVKFIPKKK